MRLLACLWGREEPSLVSPGKESEENDKGDKGQGAETQRGLLSSAAVTGSSKAHFSPEPKTRARDLGIHDQG